MKVEISERSYETLTNLVQEENVTAQEFLEDLIEIEDCRRHVLNIRGQAPKRCKCAHKNCKG